MLSLERSTDYPLIRSVMTHVSCWDFISDDGCPSPEDFHPPPLEALIYLLVQKADQVAGVFAFMPQNSICYELHTCLLPNGRGKFGIRAAKAAFEWIWRHTPCRRIVTNV